jgi:hypothetical protein
MRPLSAVELVDFAFVLARRHYVSLLTLSAIELVVLAPVYLSYAFLGESTLPFGIPSWIADLYEVVAGSVVGGAVVVAVGDAYRGRPIDLSACLRTAMRRAWPLAVTGLLTAVLTLIGLVLLIVPGLWVLVRLFAVTPAVVLEGQGVVAAVQRSRALSRGGGRRILATAGLAILLLLALVTALTLALESIMGNESSASFVASAVSMPAWPMLYTLLTVVYFDARVRTEALDVEILLEDLPR